MRIVLLCLLAMTGVAAAQPPGATDTKPTPATSGSDEPSPLTYTIGADAHFALGEIVDQSVAARFELGIAPGHALVARAGVGQAVWLDSEADDPTYAEILARIGYRISSRHLFAGVELGKAWFKAHYPPEEQMGHTPRWFDDFTVGALAGIKLGRVRLALDYTYDFTSPVRQIGVQLGVDIVRL